MVFVYCSRWSWMAAIAHYQAIRVLCLPLPFENEKFNFYIESLRHNNRDTSFNHLPLFQDPQTNRTLTLISKTIQSLGNLVSSRSAQQVCKEEYMAELYRSFCTPRHVRIIYCIMLLLRFCISANLR